MTAPRYLRQRSMRGSAGLMRSVAIFAAWCVFAFSRPTVLTEIPTLVFAIGFIAVLLLNGAHLAFPITIMSFPAFLLLAAVWATDRFSAIAGAGTMGVIAISGALVATNLPLPRLIRAVDIAAKCILIVSMALALISPALGRASAGVNEGVLVGIYGTKNMFGTLLALGMVTHIYSPIRKDLRFAFWVGAYVIAILTVGSVGAGLSVGIALAVGIVLWISRRSSSGVTRSLLLQSPVLIVLGVVLWVNFESLLRAFDRDMTFSGRDLIWRGSIEALARHPWAGYGWNQAFSASDEAAGIIRGYTRWYVSSSHNGLLTIALQVGLVGAILGAWIMLRAVVLALREYALHTSLNSAWLVQMSVLFITANLVESRFQWLMWFIISVTVTCLQNSHRSDAVDGGPVVRTPLGVR